MSEDVESVQLETRAERPLQRERKVLALSGSREADVCIVGAGNSAGQGALFFSRYARRVTLLARTESLGKSISQYLIDRIAATPSIEVVTGVEVAAVRGNGRLEKVVIRGIAGGEERELDAAAMFIADSKRVIAHRADLLGIESDPAYETVYFYGLHKGGS